MPTNFLGVFLFWQLPWQFDCLYWLQVTFQVGVINKWVEWFVLDLDHPSDVGADNMLVNAVVVWSRLVQVRGHLDSNSYYFLLLPYTSGTSECLFIVYICLLEYSIAWCCHPLQWLPIPVTMHMITQHSHQTDSGHDCHALDLGCTWEQLSPAQGWRSLGRLAITDGQCTNTHFYSLTSLHHFHVSCHSCI